MKSDELFAISEEIRKCTKCGLSNGRTLTVPGEGPVESKIMIIAEAPGKEEDRQGIPFVGRAGRLLDELLGRGGLDRGEVFITNVVKCRPPGNRDPKPEELKACRKWLDQQISVLRPSLIVVLGRVALKSLLGEEKIKDWHGKVVDRDGKKYFVTYHPSAGLRFKWIKEVLFEDFLELGKKIKEIKN